MRPDLNWCSPYCMSFQLIVSQLQGLFKHKRSKFICISFSNQLQPCAIAWERGGRERYIFFSFLNKCLFFHQCFKLLSGLKGKEHIWLFFFRKVFLTSQLSSKLLMTISRKCIPDSLTYCYLCLDLMPFARQNSSI